MAKKLTKEEIQSLLPILKAAWFLVTTAGHMIKNGTADISNCRVRADQVGAELKTILKE